MNKNVIIFCSEKVIFEPFDFAWSTFLNKKTFKIAQKKKHLINNNTINGIVLFKNLAPVTPYLFLTSINIK